MPPRSRALLVSALAFLSAACAQAAPPAPPGASAQGSSMAGNVIQVRASEYSFDPATIAVPAGSVTFKVTNVGAVEHEFEIFEGETVVDEVEGLLPGVTRDLPVTLEAGDYTFVCKLAGHEEQGMKGTLRVTGP